jgi:hypothetical protein
LTDHDDRSAQLKQSAWQLARLREQYALDEADLRLSCAVAELHEPLRAHVPNWRLAALHLVVREADLAFFAAQSVDGEREHLYATEKDSQSGVLSERGLSDECA